MEQNPLRTPRHPKDASTLSAQIWADARMDRAYLALLIVSAIVASLGLEQNSAATIIGAMVVAPLMLPIRAFGYSLLRLEPSMVFRALGTLVASIAIIIALSTIVCWIANRPEFGSEILSRTSVTFLGLGVAFAGGVLAALSRTERDSTITDSLVGVGISVSLVPPLCAAGITLAQGQLYESRGAFLLFVTNLVGIATACMVVFWIAGYRSESRWRAIGGLLICVAMIGVIAPTLAETGYHARQLSAIEHFVDRNVTTYIPSTIMAESTVISWKEQPVSVTTVVRSRHTPTRDQVRRLNDALNDAVRGAYRVTIVQDPAAAVAP